MDEETCFLLNTTRIHNVFIDLSPHTILNPKIEARSLNAYVYMGIAQEHDDDDDDDKPCSIT